MFEFLLFVILGWVEFAPPANRIVPMVVFVVLMVLWLLAGFTGFTVPWPHK